MLIPRSRLSKDIILGFLYLCFYFQCISSRVQKKNNFSPGLTNWNSSFYNNKKMSKIREQAQRKRPDLYKKGPENKIRGVNIGGWLVLEPWITPSLFERHHPHAVDEYTFCQYLGKEACKNELDEHWRTFLAKEDLQTLYDSGINTIRIPVGYWILGDIHDDEPWVEGSKEYLDQAIGWAEEIGLGVLIDLHTGPGSQNGFDNSGQRGDIHWDDAAEKPDGTIYYPNVERTIRVLEALSKTYLEKKGVIGLEYLNEPFVTIDLNIIKDFYTSTYPLTTRGLSQTFISDAFRFWNWFDFMQYPDYENVYLDTHHYEMFDTYVLGWSEQEHIDNVCNNFKKDLAACPLWNIVGEWSLATTDCAKWLNGYGRGARWDMTYESDTYFGTCEGRDDPDSFSEEYKNFLNRWAEYQMDAYEENSGWFFWTFKTENVTAPQWDYLEGLKRGWIPNQSDRQHKC